VLVTSDDVDRGKPDPASYLEAARQFAVPADRTVVFEDTSVGIAAGRAAGATVIGVTTTFPTLEGCDYSVQDLRAIRRVTATGPSAHRRQFGPVVALIAQPFLEVKPPWRL
jgi:sugar-phosphatase